MKRPFMNWANLFCALVLAGSFAFAEELKPYKYAKVFKGAEGEMITIVPLEPREENQFLIKFHRVDGDWNDQVILHERTAYNDKEDYSVKGEKYVSIAVRRGSYSVYPKGSRKELYVYFDEQESKNVDVAAIVGEFKKQR